MTENSLLSSGVPSQEDLSRKIPSKERRAKGPYVMIECFQKIPCDPCHHSCRFGGIPEFHDINDIPVADWDKCTGCGACVAACPGLAIFVIDDTFSDTECLIAMPYEFCPLPEKGQKVTLLDRSGSIAGRGSVERVISGKKPQGTPVVWVRAPKDLSTVARHFRICEEW